MSVSALSGLLADIVTGMESEDASLSSTEVATLLELDRRTVHRIPREQLNYWLTPGGGIRQHRRYRRSDVVAYAAEHLGRSIR